MPFRVRKPLASAESRRGADTLNLADQSQIGFEIEATAEIVERLKHRIA